MLTPLPRRKMRSVKGIRKGRKRVIRSRKERKREKGRKMTRRMTRKRVMRKWWAKWTAVALGPSSFL